MPRFRNPRWQAGGLTIHTDQQADGRWAYATVYPVDDTEVDSGSGYGTEDEAVRDALDEIEGLPDYRALQAGHTPWRAPDYESPWGAAWWGPGRTLAEVERVTTVEDGCVNWYEWVQVGEEGEEEAVWAQRSVCPDPAPNSPRLLAAVAQVEFDEHGGSDEGGLTEEEFLSQFTGIIPEDDSAVASSNPSELDLSVWLTFVVYAVVGLMNEADAIMAAHGARVRRVAETLRRQQPLELGRLYRGILIDPRRVRQGQIKREAFRTFESYSENRDVACWFADPQSVISQVVVARFPAARGYIASPRVTPERILWHHDWLRVGPEGRTISVGDAARQLAMRSGQFDPGQFEWNVRTQEEVLAEPGRKAKIKVKPAAAYDCPASDELDARFTYPPFLEQAISGAGGVGFVPF